MAVASEYSGWVKELDHYEASLGDVDDDDGRVEASGANRRPSSRGSTVGIGTGRKSKPSRPSVAEELQQEMKLLNWHKLANEAALKAAIIKTNKIKTEDSRFANSLAFEDAEEKRQRIQQIVEEEQLRPLQVNTEFFRDFEAREQRDEVKVETDVQRHIQHLKKLKETMAQREDLHRRRQTYKEGMAELGGGLKSHSVPKGHKSNQEEEISAHSNKRYQRSVSTAQRSDAANAEVICSLDKLMELEKRIRHLEDAGLGVDGLDGGYGGEGIILEDIDDDNVTSTKNIRFSKRKSSGTSNEPSKTVYAVKTVTKARAKDYHSVAQSTASSAARKRSLSTTKPKPQETFLTSLPENKQRQLRRMTDRERRNFLKKEKASEVQQQQHKQDVVIQDWMQKKKQAAQQRQTTSHRATVAASVANASTTRRGAGKPLPPPPKVKPPIRGAAAGKHIANPHLQKFDDIRKTFDKRKEAMNKAPTMKNGGSNKVLDLRTSTQPKKLMGGSVGPGISGGRGPLASSTAKGSSHAVGMPSSSTSRHVPAASHMPSAPSNNQISQRRASGDAYKLPAISRTPPPIVPSAPKPQQLGLSNQRPGVAAAHMATGSSAAQSRSSAGVTLPKLSGVQRGGLAMPSPPPASAKNPAMPQFSRLHKR